MNDNKKSLYAVIIFLFIGFILIQNKRSSSSSEITENEIMGHIRYLSHEKREGRYPGSRGSKDAISYIVKKFKSFGVLPGVSNSYIQPFNIKTGVELGDSNYTKINNRILNVKEDYIPLFFSGQGKSSGLAVFAGYGFKINEKELVWDDYKNIDVDGKWVIVMRHSPERENKHSIYTEHSSLHKKMLVARDAGAIGVLFVSQKEDDGLFPLQYMKGYNNGGIPALHLSNDIADDLFKKTGWTRERIQKTMNKNLSPLNFDLNSIKIETNVNLSTQTSRAANVIGLIKSGNREFRDEYVVIGAHFDHVGHGGLSSGSRKPKENLIHPGADDNASGTAGLIELAQKLSAQKSRLKRSVLLIGFDAEEKGLLGSKYFISNPIVDLEKITTMINMDMIGRMKDSTFTIGGVGTSPIFNSLLDSLSKNKKFKINKTLPGFGPSDHAAFYSKEIPVLFFFTGFHDEYHTPDDTWRLINLNGQKSILDFVYEVTFFLARSPQRPPFSEAGPRNNSMEKRTAFKVTFGIMPNYGSAAIGLEIDQISNTDGPAAKAGIVSGDIIKSINGKEIKNIYEYMERLGELESGTSIPVKIERNKKIIELNVSF